MGNRHGLVVGTRLSKVTGTAERVEWKGYCHNPHPYMAQADLFILRFSHEGFPNVVLEANTCGAPVVAFHCPGGAREIKKFRAVMILWLLLSLS